MLCFFFVLAIRTRNLRLIRIYHTRIEQIIHPHHVCFMKTVIVESESKTQDILLKIIQEHYPGIQVIGIASGVYEARDLILKHKPELVFLDIEMPGDSDFMLLHQFAAIGCHLIVTTACDEPFLSAPVHGVFAYLHKPIDFEKLKQAVEALKRYTASNGLAAVKEKNGSTPRLSFSGKLAIPVREGVFDCPVQDVIRIESDGSYSTLYVSGGKRYVISKGLKEYEELLPAKEFFRVHKSHLINIHKIKKYVRNDGNLLEMADGSLIEVARRKKGEFLKVVDAMR